MRCGLQSKSGQLKGSVMEPIENLARHTIRWGSIAVSAWAGAWALQPVLARPVLWGLVTTQDVVLFAGFSVGGWWLVARSWHWLDTNAKERKSIEPPDISLAPGTTFAHAIRVPELRGPGLVSHTPKTLDPEKLWRWKVLHWARWGTIAGFGYRAMGRLCDRPTWDYLSHRLIKEEVLAKGRGNQPNHWAPGWNVGRLRAALYAGAVDLPCPAFTYIIR